MMKKRRLFGLVLAILLAVGMLPMSVFAGDAKTYLAIGDSISTGCGLADPGTQSFTAQLAEMLGSSYTYVNLAEDGETAQSLYQKLSGDAFQAAVTGADVITLTIGGNDLMNLLYEFLADNMEITPKMTAEEVADALAAGDMDVINAAAEATIEKNFSLSSADVSNAVQSPFKNSIDRIRTLNPDAVLIVADQYNPYGKLAALLKQYESFLAGSDYETPAKAIFLLSDQIEAALGELNSIITGYSSGKYEVAKVWKAFNAGGNNLCNAGVTLFPVTVNLDIHPSAEGHSQIAKEFQPMLPKAEVYQPIQVGGVNLENGEYTTDGITKQTGTPSGGYASYKDGVLTLNDFSYSGGGGNQRVISAEQALKIQVLGTNTIRSAEMHGIIVEGDLEIYGGGSLTVIPKEEGAMDVLAIQAWTGAASIKNVTLNLQSGGDGINARGITLDGVTADIQTKDGICLRSGYPVKIANSTLRLASEDASCIFAADSSIEIESSMVIASGNVALNVNPGGDIKLVSGSFQLSGASEKHGAIYAYGSTLTLPTADYWWRTSADGEFTKNGFTYDEQLYIELTTTQPHTHAWDTQWSADAIGHWHSCTPDCPITDNTQKDGYTPHTAPADDGSCKTAVTCPICDYEFTPAAADHSFTTTASNQLASPADCQNKAAYYAKCDNCDAASDTVTVLVGDVAEHNWDSKWTTDGENHWHKCLTSGCTAVQDQAAHDYTDLQKSDTEHWYICTVCDAEKPASRQAHKGGTATCTGKAKCEVCGSEYGEVKGHGETEIRNAKAATCDKDGYTGDKHCKVCGGKLETGKAIAKTGHSYKWVIDKEATSSTTGIKHEECACGAKRSENTVIPKVATPATGDGSRIFLWFGLMIASGLTLLVLIRKRRQAR